MNRSKYKNLSRISLFSALMIVCAFVCIPLPIPFTLQIFALMLGAAVLGGKGALVSTLIYVALGALGLPVFSGGKSGLGAIFGATGGYIIGFLPCSFVVGKLCEKTKKRPILIGLSMLAGLLTDYVIGVLWFAFAYLDGGQSVLYAVTTGILPFVIPDILKIVLAVIVAVRVVCHAKL